MIPPGDATPARSPATGGRSARLFFALWPDAACRTRLVEVVAEALGGGAWGRAVPPEDWHVTLDFLGAVPEARAGQLEAAVAVVRSPPVTLHLDRLRYWSDSRVAVVEGACPPEAARLAAALRAVARALGLSPDGKPLRPHITWMRGLARAVPDARVDVTLSADAFVLAESREGVAAPAARYRVRARWPLAG